MSDDVPGALLGKREPRMERRSGGRVAASRMWCWIREWEMYLRVKGSRVLADPIEAEIGIEMRKGMPACFRLRRDRCRAISTCCVFDTTTRLAGTC